MEPKAPRECKKMDDYEGLGFRVSGLWHYFGHRAGSMRALAKQVLWWAWQNLGRA